MRGSDANEGIEPHWIERTKAHGPLKMRNGGIIAMHQPQYCTPPTLTSMLCERQTLMPLSLLIGSGTFNCVPATS